MTTTTPNKTTFIWTPHHGYAQGCKQIDGRLSTPTGDLEVDVWSIEDSDLPFGIDLERAAALWRDGGICIEQVGVTALIVPGLLDDEFLSEAMWRFCRDRFGAMDRDRVSVIHLNIDATEKEWTPEALDRLLHDISQFDEFMGDDEEAA